MDSFEWNKIAGAVLGTALFVMVVRIASEAIYYTPPPAKPGYEVAGVEEATPGAANAAPVEEPLPDWATVIPAANAGAGQQIAVRCAQCHDWSKGGPNKIGPNLWGIIGRARGTHPGFSYSAAMAKKGGSWSYDDLFRYLKQPAAFVPGNKMAFAGLPKAADRINLIAFMRSWADSPPPLPPHHEAAAPATPNAGAPGNAAAGTPGGTHPTHPTIQNPKPNATPPAHGTNAPAPHNQ
jgi:cytochrome c